MAETKNAQRLIFPNVENNPLDNVRGTGNVFNGVERVGLDAGFDVLVSGYAFIKWTRLPAWFEKDPDLKYWATMTEKFFKSFNGITDTELTTSQRQTGFANRQVDSVAGVSNNNNDFSMDFDEFSGSPFRNLVWKWINMIRDERTGLARYPEKYGVEYGQRNHSADLLYVMVRPDADNIGNMNRIEYAAYYTNVIPVNSPDGTLYNYQMGSNDSPKITLQFKGFQEKGPRITKYAYKILDEQIVTRNPDADGKIFIDSFMDNEDILNNVADGYLKDILNVK